MEVRNGWLERSLDRAQANIKARPEHLKPERYRSPKHTANAAPKKKSSIRGR